MELMPTLEETALLVGALALVAGVVLGGMRLVRRKRTRTSS